MRKIVVRFMNFLISDAPHIWIINTVNRHGYSDFPELFLLPVRSCAYNCRDSLCAISQGEYIVGKLLAVIV